MSRAAKRRRPRSTLGKLPGAVRAGHPGFIAPSLATAGQRLPKRQAPVVRTDSVSPSPIHRQR
jgi:hypothetical protein